MSETKRLQSAAEFKFNGQQAGMFEGYASVFGVRDQGGDVVLPGAFKEFARTGEGKVVVLWQHQLDNPIGKADVHQDAHGLQVRGQLALEDPLARKAYNLMQAKVVDGMSFAYEILPGGAAQKSDRRELSALKCYEVSVVTLGMNQLARIEAVKSAAACESLRDLEQLLREQLLLSNRKAKAGASALWPIVSARDPEDQDLARELERLAILNRWKGKSWK